MITIDDIQSGKYDFIILMLIIGFCLCGYYYYYLFHKVPKKRTGPAIQKAKSLASSEWQIIEVGTFEDDAGHLQAVVAELQSLDCRQKEIIPFRPFHPSIKVLQSCKKYQIVKFIFMEKPMEYALEFEVCAYLLVEKAN